jgi:hypothetical protein
MSQDFSTRLYQFEVTPPPQAWQQISKELEPADDMDLLAKRMLAFEVAPPTQVWTSIQSDLVETPVIPIHSARQQPPFILRPVWVAAAFIAFFIGGMWYYQVSPLDPSPLTDKAFAVPVYSGKSNTQQYIPYKSPSGSLVKVSKRIHESFFQFESTDTKNKQNRPSTKQLDQWRSRILAANYMPSTDNLFSIIEMHEMLSEK